MTLQPLIRAATAADLTPILRLLEAESLPVSDLAEAQPRFLIACAGTQPVAAGALEIYGTAALLRSVAVSASWQRRGLGRRIVKALEREARAAGVGQLFLLTTSAAAFFAGLDYRPIERAAVPAAVCASTEFRSLCPATAVCLAKTLR